MEVGLHEMDGLHPRDMKIKMFEDLGISRKGGIPCRFPNSTALSMTGRTWSSPTRSEEAKVILKKAFPGEEKGIDAYFWHHVPMPKGSWC